MIWIALVALFASFLTFFSGFGLGTLLLPTFSLFFSVELSIALTGIVHLLNNLFKLVLVGKFIDWKIIMKFGVAALLGAVVGAYLLLHLSGIGLSWDYQIGSVSCQVTMLKSIIAILMMGFAVVEFMPSFKYFGLREDRLWIGGAISGFFGGLSGHQGALRSAFLIKYNLSKEVFIATGVMIACLVDVSRLLLYKDSILENQVLDNWKILAVATSSALIGAVLGKKILNKVTIAFVQKLVAIFIFIMAFAMLIGLI